MSSELLLDIALIVVAAGVSVVAGFLMVHFWFEFRGHRRYGAARAEAGERCLPGGAPITKEIE